MKQLIFMPEFERRAKRLSVDIRERLKKQINFLEIDPFHPYLHSKSLKEKWQGFYSFRITRNYRCIFEIRGRSKITSSSSLRFMPNLFEKT